MLRQGLRLTQTARLDLERLVLARLEFGALDFLHYVPQIVGPATHFVPPLRQRRLVGTEPGHRRVGLGHGRALGLRVREGVEDVALGVGPQQRLGLVLSMEVHQ